MALSIVMYRFHILIFRFADAVATGASGVEGPSPSVFCCPFSWLLDGVMIGVSNERDSWSLRVRKSCEACLYTCDICLLDMGEEVEEERYV